MLRIDTTWYGFIYKTTNLVNGKIYIGQRSYRADNSQGIVYLGSGERLALAIKKYGKVSFSREILVCCKDLESLNEQEIFWISHYNSRDLEGGYNLTVGGEGIVGTTWDHLPDKQERLLRRNQKIRVALTGLKQTSERVSKKSTNWHKQEKLGCIFCKRDFPRSISLTHVRFCLQNKDREIRRHSETLKVKQRETRIRNGTNKLSEEHKLTLRKRYRESYPKKECTYCNKLLPVNVYEKHINTHTT